MKSISYMGFQPGEPLLGKKVDYVFWVPAPMDALRISVHLPPLDVYKRQGTTCGSDVETES